MKIGIVTVYNTYNCGSFFQAYALSETLKKEGNEVYFCKRRLDKMQKFTYRMLLCAKYLVKGDFEVCKNIFTGYFAYKKLRNGQKTVENCDGLDVVVYGSDTIWNMDDPEFKNNWKKYWGYGVKSKKITYSASVASTSAEKILNRQELVESLSEFSGLALRDEYTYDVVKKALPQRDDLVRTVDPTMLLDAEEYNVFDKGCKERDFILFYIYQKLPENILNQVKEYAKKNGKKLIAFGNYDWADIKLPADPFYFISYYKKADFVVTNTFHGNMFAILFGKKFVNYGIEKKKIQSLLSEFGLSHCLINENDNILSVIEKPINYEAVKEKIKEKRNESIRYLKSHLN